MTTPPSGMAARALLLAPLRWVGRDRWVAGVVKARQSGAAAMMREAMCFMVGAESRRWCCEFGVMESLFMRTFELVWV